jgi:hypothetical protein
VRVIGPIVREFGPAPWFCRDGVLHNGTVTALARGRDDAEPYGMTCAHCMAGDGNGAATPMSLWDDSQQDWLPVGTSGPMVDLPGLGQPNDFGFSDWGLFPLSDSEIASQARGGQPLMVGATPIGLKVVARSSHGVLTGRVAHGPVQIEDTLADLLIAVDGEGTFGGDSGLLWRSAASGRGVAIHAAGAHEDGEPHLSVCMSARRIKTSVESAELVMIDPQPA